MAALKKKKNCFQKLIVCNFFSQITRLLWDRKVHFVVYNDPPLDPFLRCAMNWFHISNTFFFFNFGVTLQATLRSPR